MLEAIYNRISRRSFLNEELTNNEIKQIQLYLEKINKESNLTIEFLNDGSIAFRNLRKSYGLFTNVKSLILMKGMQKDTNLKEKIGYYGEELVLYLTTLGLGTCWVGGTFDQAYFQIKENESLICVIVVGKVDNLTLKEKMIRATISKNRKGIEQRLIADTKELPPWLVNGMEAVRLAPSAKNAQNPVFYYKEGKVFAEVIDNYEFDLVDLGIAKKHFEIATDGRFLLGNGSIFTRRKEE